MRIDIKNAAGLVIDIQEKLLPAMTGSSELTRRCVQLVQGWSILKVPMLVTQQYTRGLGNTVDEIASLLPIFQPIEKRAFSCCGEPLFMDALRSLTVQQVIICGIESHVCVLQTAVDLKDAGFSPIVVMDAVASRHPFDMEMARERFRCEGITMATVESVLFELTRTSEAPTFKAISALVK